MNCRFVKEILLNYLGQNQVVDVLIRHNANVNIQDDDKHSPLHIAAELGMTIECNSCNE